MQRIFPVLMLAGVGLAGMGLGRGGDAFAQQPIGNGAASKPMIKVEVRDPKRPQAQCNDGSPPVFYFQPGSGPDRNKWVIYLEGGTACMSDASCKQRAVSKPYLVTGSKVPATMIAKGILSTQTSANPDFAHYNHVLAHYCSSDFWAGDTERRIGDATWQFRGRDIVDALIDQLSTRPIGNAPTLAAATEVFVTGSSAGAMGVHNNLDRIAARLPQATVKGLADSGWIPANLKPFGPGLFGTVNIYGPEALAFYNAKPDDSCVSANPSSAGACLNQEVAFPYVSTPMFVYADQRDPSMLSVVGILGPPSNKAELEYTARFGRGVREGLAKTPAYFAAGRTKHTVILTPEFSTVAIGGVKFTEALGNWYFDRPGARQIVAKPPAGR